MFVQLVIAAMSTAPWRISPSPFCVGLAVPPIKYAAQIPRHHPFVRFSEEGFFRLGLECAARFPGGGVLAVDAADARDGVVEISFRHIELSASHGGQGGAVFPEDPVARRAVLDGVLAIDQGVAGELEVGVVIRGAAGEEQGNEQDDGSAPARRGFR